ncbi:MAG: transglutaminase-like domain-containing protein [Bacteroidales bacterium]|jgi:regulator of sirC expression with transglutaminase-like and TPR domain|nr:transglutaminase-like domain-containing protein [Bacteroidales bacterium]
MQNQIDTLITLLEDPDPRVFESIAMKLIELGVDVVPILEEKWETIESIESQTKIEEVVKRIQTEHAKNRLSEWAEKGGKDLLDGVFWVCKYQYPNINISSIKEQIERTAEKIWLEVNDNYTALEKIRILNHIFFTIEGYERSKKNYLSPKCYYINEVLSTKSGNSISLGLIYQMVANKLNIPVYGINLPKNYILGYKDKSYTGIDVLFYINPDNKGSVFSKDEITLYLEKNKIESRSYYFSPTSNISVIHNLLRELYNSYNDEGNKDKANDIKQIVTEVERHL